jgi:hypothetical protein
VQDYHLPECYDLDLDSTPPGLTLLWT